MPFAEKSIRAFREQFHPLFYLRKSKLGRGAIRLVDRPAWISVPGVGFPVRGLLVTHGLAFAATGSQEPSCEALVLSCVRHLELRSFWDVGANIGHYTWLLKTAVPHLSVVLFEALPANAALIRQTLDRCSFPDITLVSAGVSEQAGTALLRTNAVAGATSSLESEGATFEERHWGVPAGTLSIPLVSIDEQRAHHGSIDLMKIDVEGHEAAVLRGAQQTIDSDQPILFVECGHPNHACLLSLENQGYRIIDADHLTTDLRPDVSISNYFGFPSRFSSQVDEVLAAARDLTAQNRRNTA
ncbi:FkbM family methyltransferase [Paracidobacterium acidisoli]|uniref:FkbM family methyltransferase n=1 Tax=Paracidobacterium acidisoli TaxID=2303751 RepID=A0A372IMJ7_9BACT|nr:FkbM family methyltransferase [Paracidobacterium acidisoli]MBT9331823.1 FkbM family methyltransferase [Paracidobacterium acidisoli]